MRIPNHSLLGGLPPSTNADVRPPVHVFEQRQPRPDEPSKERPPDQTRSLEKASTEAEIMGASLALVVGSAPVASVGYRREQGEGPSEHQVKAALAFYQEHVQQVDREYMHEMLGIDVYV